MKGVPPRGALRTPAKPPRPVPGARAGRARVSAARVSRDGNRPGRVSLLWRRQRRLLRPVGFGVLGLVLLVAVAGLVRSVQPGSTIASWRERLGGAAGFEVETVVIEGREKTPEGMLRAALGVHRGDKLLGFSLEAARRRIEDLAWVQSATVERRLPGTVVVSLRERRPFAVWQNAGKFVLIDRQGQVVVEQDPAKDPTAFATLPLVVGPGAPEGAAALLDLLAGEPALRSRVVAAVRVGERRWNLRLGNGADVLLPEGNAAAAIGRLMELQASEQLLDRPVAAIDLRLGDRLVVRPVPDAKPPLPRRPA